MTLLINQLDEHNESGIIYLIKNKVEEVLFLYDTEQIDLMKSIREYYASGGMLQRNLMEMSVS